MMFDIADKDERPGSSGEVGKIPPECEDLPGQTEVDEAIVRIFAIKIHTWHCHK